MSKCKWLNNEFCVNSYCPMRADYCPVPDYPGVCRFEEREKEAVFVNAGTLKISEASEEDCEEFYKGFGKELERVAINNSIAMIDEELLEPNSIAPEWVMVLKLCRMVLREKVKAYGND